MTISKVSGLKERLANSPESLFALASLALLLLPALPPFRSLESVSGWLKPYYYINYFDLGFIKRGLIGTIYTLVGVPSWLDDPALIVVISHTFVSLVVAGLFWLFAHRQLQHWPLSIKLAVYSFFLLSPAFFLRLGFDTGRIDLWCLAISIASLLLITNRSISLWPASMITGISIAIQMLIHDASILFYSPLLLATLLNRNDYSSFRFRTKIVYSLPVITSVLLTGIALLIWGRYEPGQDILDRALVELHPGLAGGMPMELTWTLRENIRLALSGLSLWTFFGGHTLILVYFIICILLTLSLTATTPLLMKATAFSPLILSFLATDSLRFLGLSVVSMFLLILVAGGGSNQLRFSKPLALSLPVLAAFFFAFGPWGSGALDPLPLLKYVPWRI